MNTNSNIPANELESLMVAARWLARQFDEINCPSIANLFQRAVEDAEAWIHSMEAANILPPHTHQRIAEREAQAIHRILVKYASLNDPNTREQVLQRMLNLTINPHLAN